MAPPKMMRIKRLSAPILSPNFSLSHVQFCFGYYTKIAVLPGLWLPNHDHET